MITGYYFIVEVYLKQIQFKHYLNDCLGRTIGPKSLLLLLLLP